jgi:hypothetical protein
MLIDTLFRQPAPPARSPRTRKLVEPPGTLTGPTSHPKLAVDQVLQRLPCVAGVPLEAGGEVIGQLEINFGAIFVALDNVLRVLLGHDQGLHAPMPSFSQFALCALCDGALGSMINPTLLCLCLSSFNNNWRPRSRYRATDWFRLSKL